jgi:hypothetical protein
MSIQRNSYVKNYLLLVAAFREPQQLSYSNRSTLNKMRSLVSLVRVFIKISEAGVSKFLLSL